MTLDAFVNESMLKVAPDRDHAELRGAIVRAAEASPPLFVGDTDRHRTSALLVAVAFRESSLRLDVVGDHGRSFCAMQIHDSSGGSPALLTDADACIRKGLAMLRESLRTCPASPVAWYAAGPRGCSSAHAQRISLDRMRLAAWLVRSVDGAAK